MSGSQVEGGLKGSQRRCEETIEDTIQSKTKIMVAWTRMVMKVMDSRNSQTRQAARLASFVVIGDKLQLTSRMLLRYTISFQQIVATLVIITKILSFIFSSLKKSCFETGIIFKFSKISTIL